MGMRRLHKEPGKRKLGEDVTVISDAVEEWIEIANDSENLVKRLDREIV